MTPTIERELDGQRKVFAVNAASLDDNCLKGVANVTGIMDRGRDCIYPKAFTPKLLKEFLKIGFVPDTHNWTWSGVVAMPTKAEMRGNSLYSECEFHSDENSQMVRTKCRERMDRGLAVGLSIGFSIDEEGLHFFENGEQMLAHAEGLGEDMSLFDTKAIRAHKKYCWGISKIKELFEYSPVPVPMNQQSYATQVKSLNINDEREFEAFLRDAGWSRKLATAITLHGFKATYQRDAEQEEQTDTHEAKALADLRLRASRFTASLIGVNCEEKDAGACQAH